MRRIPHSTFQYIASKDLDNGGRAMFEGFDALTADAVGSGKYWTGMSVVPNGNFAVTVTSGRIYRNGVFFGDLGETQTTVQLAVNAPTNARKIIAIVGYGAEEEAAFEPRSFLDQATGLKISDNVATEIRRNAKVDKVATAGESTSPTRPEIDPGYVPIAWVTMSASGIEAIEMASDFRLPSLEVVNGRVVALEEFRETAGTMIDTIQTDLAVTNGKIGSFNTPLLRQMPRRIAAIESRLGIDESVSLWGFEHFMDETKSDKTGVGYKARVEEGLRAPWAASEELTPALLNPAEPRVKTTSGWTLPVYTETLRLDIWGQAISVNMSNYQYANTGFLVYPGATRRRRYGPSQVFTTNSELWSAWEYTGNYLTQTFKKGSETWQITDQWTEGGVTYYRAQQYWDDKIKYWIGYGRSATETVENGYMLAQTWMNSRAGWLTKIGLRFNKVDPQHGVRVYLCLAPKGVPDPEQIVATGTILAGAAQTSNSADGVENLVTISPVYLDPGQRYAVILVSGGDYGVACRSDNALSNGTLFFSDGNTFVADLGKDMSLRLYFAKFATPYVAVDLGTVTLSGGITDIDLLTTEQTPDGTDLEFQIQKDGVWHRIEAAEGTHPLASKPTTLPMRAVFIGTGDVMPAISLADSRIRLRRVDDDLVHWSEVRNAGTGVTSIKVEVKLVNWKPVSGGGKHTLATTIEYSGGSDTPDTTVDETLPDGSVLRTYTFTITSSSTYQIKIVGTTTDIVDWFVPYERYDEAA